MHWRSSKFERKIRQRIPSYYQLPSNSEVIRVSVPNGSSRLDHKIETLSGKPAGNESGLEDRQKRYEIVHLKIEEINRIRLGYQPTQPLRCFYALC